MQHATTPEFPAIPISAGSPGSVQEDRPVAKTLDTQDLSLGGLPEREVLDEQSSTIGGAVAADHANTSSDAGLAPDTGASCNTGTPSSAEEIRGLVASGRLTGLVPEGRQPAFDSTKLVVAMTAKERDERAAQLSHVVRNFDRDVFRVLEGFPMVELLWRGNDPIGFTEADCGSILASTGL